MAILAKEGIDVELLLRQPLPITATWLPESIYEEEKKHSNSHAERARQLLNAQLKVVWRIICAKATAQRILCRDML